MQPSDKVPKEKIEVKRFTYLKPHCESGMRKQVGRLVTNYVEYQRERETDNSGDIKSKTEYGECKLYHIFNMEPDQMAILQESSQIGE